ncbi:UDP-glycosyltransferase 91C1 [Momordica charantia]|uniref:UDP-glycosyltransferase 91C1 n=1 Tax=Momordica charantia TaxID=3673 RepID=A0A6J1CZS6_MOMCH|nr:UDP-glycosyltransferase 91C1 [Momordica charantia]
MENDGVLHVVVFPWLALGHLIPFARLATCLAHKGLTVSFVSTPRNLSRIPKIPPHLSSAVNLVAVPLPHVDGLPDGAEASSDVPYNKQQLLKKAFDSLESPLAALLRDLNPDWIIYDYASHWLPPLAAELCVSCAFFSLFTAAFLAFIGPPSVLIGCGGSRSTVEDFTEVPEWMPPGSNIAFRYHEIKKSLDGATGNESGTPDTIRFGTAIEESVAVAIRSSPELEPELFDLLARLYKKPVIPVGFLPPLMEDTEELSGDIREWLDKQSSNSVLYVAFGTEATLSQDDVTELAFGLEQSGIPFLWILRTSHRSESGMLPAGFKERVGGRGMVHEGWVPQVKILSHDSVGGCLSHCGWNSIIEGLGFGRVMILFPVVNDQGLNARLLEEKKVGIEIERNERDGSFRRESVAESVRSAMAASSGELLREKAMEMKGLFGDEDKNVRQLDEFVQFLRANRNK